MPLQTHIFEKVKLLIITVMMTMMM